MHTHTYAHTHILYTQTYIFTHVRNGVFPAMSVNKEVTVISDSSPPGHSGRKRISAKSGSHEAVATPYGEHRGTQDVKKTQDTDPRIAEMHMKGMISVSPDSCIFMKRRKTLNYVHSMYIEKHPITY